MNDDSLFVFGGIFTPEHIAHEARSALSGLSHANLITPFDPSPGQPVTVHAHSSATAGIREVTVYYTTNGHDTREGVAVNAALVDTAWDSLVRSYVDHWKAVLPSQPAGTQVRYSVVGRSIRGELVEADAHTDRPPRFGYDVDTLAAPSWIDDAVIYQIFVDRFADGDNPVTPRASISDPYAGNLDGITAHLDYLSDLGINVLWLTPIFEAETYHAYDALDYERIADRVGGEPALRHLVDAAHRRGIRILLDLAANHVSYHNPRFLDAQRSEDSRYHDWFRWIAWPDSYHSFTDAHPYLPQLNTWNPAVASYLAGVASYYLTDVGVDGFRLDHAHGPPHVFWSGFRSATRHVAPDSYTVGEVTLEPDALRKYQGRLDGCLDFPVLAAFRAFFIDQSLDAAAFDAFLNRNNRFYQQDFSRPTFLDNHDMNRFLWVAGNDKDLLRMAAVCQFSQPQPPIIYYGTEIGLSQSQDVSEGGHEAARLPMPWDNQDKELLAFYQALIRARHSHPSMRGGERHALVVDDGLYAYLCTRGQDRVVVALNRTESTRDIDLPFDGTSLLTGSPVSASLTLEPGASALIGDHR